MRDEPTQRRFFEELAGRYDDRLFRQRWPRNQELKAGFVLDALAPLPHGATVVELGCGTGQIAAILLGRRPDLRYVGLDLSPAMLALARERLAAHAARVRLEPVSGALPLEPGAAQAAFGIDVLHHVERPVDTLSELRTATAPGSPVVFLEGNPRFPLTALIALARREERGLLELSRPTLRRWFEAAGIADVEVTLAPLFTPPGPPALAPLYDRLDRSLARAPLLRELAIFFRARGVA